VGSAVHNTAWLPPAVEFLGRAARTGAPVWCFSVCGLAKPYTGNRFTRMLAASERGRLEQAFPPAFAPRDHRLFPGVVETKGTPLWGRAFYRLTGGGPGDHRDWPAVQAWAREVAAALPRHRAAAPGPRA
jgi:menaquinone-dependent protoporphyrinogen oxidase